MIKHNLCANISADVELLVAKLAKVIFFPQRWAWHKFIYANSTSKSILSLIIFVSTIIYYLFCAISFIMTFCFHSLIKGLFTSYWQNFVLVNKLFSIYICGFIGCIILSYLCIEVSNGFKYFKRSNLFKNYHNYMDGLSNKISYSFKKYSVNVRDAKMQKILKHEK